MCRIPSPSFTYTMYVLTTLVPFRRVSSTLPVASTGTLTVMFMLVPLGIIPFLAAVKLIVDATLLALITAVLLMLERYWSSPR